MQASTAPAEVTIKEQRARLEHPHAGALCVHDGALEVAARGRGPPLVDRELREGDEELRLLAEGRDVVRREAVERGREALGLVERRGGEQRLRIARLVVQRRLDALRRVVEPAAREGDAGEPEQGPHGGHLFVVGARLRGHAGLVVGDRERQLSGALTVEAAAEVELRLPAGDVAPGVHVVRRDARLAIVERAREHGDELSGEVRAFEHLGPGGAQPRGQILGHLGAHRVVTPEHGEREELVPRVPVGLVARDARAQDGGVALFLVFGDGARLHVADVFDLLMQRHRARPGAVEVALHALGHVFVDRVAEEDLGRVPEEAKQRRHADVPVRERVAHGEQRGPDALVLDHRAELAHAGLGDELVCVEDEHPVAGRGLQADVARRGEVAGPRGVEDLRAGLGRERHGRVGRARVDDDPLVPEALNGLDKARQKLGFVAYDHTDGERGSHGVPRVGSARSRARAASSSSASSRSDKSISSA